MRMKDTLDAQASETISDIQCQVDALKAENARLDATKPQWQVIETAPRYEPVRVRLDCGFEAVAEYKARGCTGMCVPKGQKPHTPHIHDEWVFVDEDGDELHPLCGYKTIEPTHWMHHPTPPTKKD